MDKTVSEIYQCIQKLVGAHRQLLDLVRMERTALTEANLKGIQEATYAKEGLVQHIRQIEAQRMKWVGMLATKWKRPAEELTLSNIAIAIQGDDLKSADALRSAQGALAILVQRIIDQNQSNRSLVEKSLEHVNQMKGNVLRESTPRSDTYTPSGQKSAAPRSSRLISKEA